RGSFDMVSAAMPVQPSISRTTEKIMLTRLIDPAPPRASELPAPSAAPARPASEDVGQCSCEIIPGDDRETSSRPNRRLCHRGSHNDDDYGCKIIRYQPLSARRQEPHRSR